MTHNNADMISWFRGFDAFAALIAADAPAFVMTSDPFAVQVANVTGLALFSQPHEQALTDWLRASTDVGARRLRALAASRKPDAPRLERLRFMLRGSSELVTFLCVHTRQNGQEYLLGTAISLHEALQKDVEAAKLAMLAARDAAASASPAIEPVGVRPLRFLFQTDAAGTITQISPEFATTGLAFASHVIGKSFADLLPVSEVTAALGGHKTWRLEGLFWPLQELDHEVPVTFAASPLHNSAHNFSGYRGFGIVHFDQIRAREVSPVAETVVPQAELVPAPAMHSAAPVAPDTKPLPEPSALSSVPDNVVSLHPERAGVERPVLAREADIAPLSAAERLAFREIAKALGAKLDFDEPAPVRLQPVAPAATFSEPEPMAAPQSLVLNKALESFARGLEPVMPVAAEQQPQTAAVEPATVPSEPLPDIAAEQPVSRVAEFEGMALGVWIFQDDAPVYANPAVLTLLGYEGADNYSLQERCLLSASALNPQQTWDSPVSLYGAKGEALSFDCVTQPFTWNGAAATLVFLLRAAEPDLSPRLKALELDLRARESEARELHDILDTATDGIVVLDDEGHILSVNRSAEALLGYEQSDVLGASFTVLLAAESHAAALDYLDGLKSNGVASVLNDGRDVLGRERNGGLVPMFMTLGRVGQGTHAKFCAVLRDVTHWKKAECELRDARQEAERANAQKSNFLAKISHEIRTPLNAILGFTEVIWQERFGPIGNERYKDYLKDIHASGTLVMSLVNDLLDLSKIESGKLDLSFVSVNANLILQDCVALMQPQATKERVIIRVSLAPRLPNIVADERSLRQILINLLSNAVKFNQPGGQVIVSTALTDAGHAVIRIRDTGIGMNESDIERALEPFRQLETSRKSHGTGLGLPLTKAMAEANRAAFTLKSKRGEGTLAEVTFPPTRVLAE